MPDTRITDLKNRIDSAIARHGFTPEEMRAARRRRLLQRSAAALVRLGASMDKMTAATMQFERAMRAHLHHFRGEKGQAHG